MYDNRLPDEPILMPWQAFPFNNDTFVAGEFLKLKNRFGIMTAVELGACVGGTTKWLSENFAQVHTIEIQENFLNIAKRRCAGKENISYHHGSTVYLLARALSQCNSRSILFIDSHWNEHFPIFDELEIIKKSGLRPVLAIHDFQVPNDPAMGFDSYNGVALNFENIKKHIEDIYGPDGYEYHYNSAERSTEVKRGVIYIYPKQ